MSVEVFLLISLFVGLGALAGIFVWLHMRSKDQSTLQLQEVVRQIVEAQKQDQSVQFLQREIGTLREQLSKSLSDSAKLMMDSQKTVGDRLDRAAEVVGNVQKALGALDSSTKQVYEVGKNIAQLEEILRAPKARGAFGELFLGELLSQILPPQHYKLQHAFRSGEIVDAVVKIGHLVSVDAKFPLENFKRLMQTQNPQEKTQARRKFISDVKKHIDAISSKYILPDEGTFEFALMYIPVENVYYEMIVKDETLTDESSIMTYAFSKRVMPVSPNSFYTYLHTISLGLRGMQIEENARTIMDQLSRLRGDFAKFKEDFDQLGKHLSHSRGKYEEAGRRLERFGDKLASTGGKEAQEIAEAAEESSYLPLK